jgi:hypothetical protein
MKLNQINQYVKGERITTTKDGAESFDSKIDEHLTLAHMVFYVKNRGHCS